MSSTAAWDTITPSLATGDAAASLGRMRHAIDVATTAGASRLDLTASDEKLAARSLYKALG